MTKREAWDQIGRLFEKFEYDGEFNYTTGAGLCRAVGSMPTQGNTRREMYTELRAFGNNRKSLSQLWFPTPFSYSTTKQRYAGERALIAYFLDKNSE